MLRRNYVNCDFVELFKVLAFSIIILYLKICGSILNIGHAATAI